MPGKVDGILITIGSLPSRLVEQIARQVPVAVIAGILPNGTLTW